MVVGVFGALVAVVSVVVAVVAVMCAVRGPKESDEKVHNNHNHRTYRAFRGGSGSGGIVASCSCYVMSPSPSVRTDLDRFSVVFEMPVGRRAECMNHRYFHGALFHIAETYNSLLLVIVHLVQFT